MIGAGTFINPLIKIATVFAVLAAVFIFIVKPVLDTTNHALDEGSHFSNQLNHQINHAFDNIDKTQQAKVSKSVKGTSVNIPAGKIPKSAQAQLKIAECVQNAAPNTAKMQACVK